MSRRRRQASSPIESVAALLLVDQLEQVFQTVSSREAQAIRMRFGLTPAGIPIPLGEVARTIGISVDRLRELESKAMSKLRHPSRSQVLRDYLDAETVRPVSASVRDRFLGEAADREPLTWCDLHGWTIPDGAPRTCERCTCRLSSAEVGRPRKYCSDACRQAASRARRRTTQRDDLL